MNINIGFGYFEQFHEKYLSRWRDDDSAETISLGRSFEIRGLILIRKVVLFNCHISSTNSDIVKLSPMCFE